MSQPISGPCQLWGGGTLSPTTGDYDEIENARAGGLYRISGTAKAILQSRRTPLLSAKLTTWIVNQHVAGERSPLIDTSVLETVQIQASLTYSQQVRRFFEYLVWQRFRVGDAIYDFFAGASPVRAALSAWLECENDNDAVGLVRLLMREGLIEAEGPFLRLTPVGFRKLEQVQTVARDSIQAFVAMWFHESLWSAFDGGFEPAIRAAGYTAMRIDQKEHNNKVDDEIVAEIRRSRFVVADFTCGAIEIDGVAQTIARGGVYFEAGYAMGLGIPVIWTCRKDMIHTVHFDTRQFSHVVWETTDELRRALYNRICATIGEMPGAPGLR